jgi:hypothetical protein
LSWINNIHSYPDDQNGAQSYYRSSLHDFGKSSPMAS